MLLRLGRLSLETTVRYPYSGVSLGVFPPGVSKGDAASLAATHSTTNVSEYYLYGIHLVEYWAMGVLTPLTILNDIITSQVLAVMHIISGDTRWPKLPVAGGVQSDANLP